MKKFSSSINKLNLIFALFKKNGFLNCKVVSVVALGSRGQKLESKYQKIMNFQTYYMKRGDLQRRYITPPNIPGEISSSIKFTQTLSNNIYFFTCCQMMYCVLFASLSDHRTPLDIPLTQSPPEVFSLSPQHLSFL